MIPAIRPARAHLTTAERNRITKLFRNGHTKTAICKKVGVNMSTVDRTLRNSDGSREFHAVPKYRCPGCERYVVVKPCVLCAAKRAKAQEGER